VLIRRRSSDDEIGITGTADEYEFGGTSLAPAACCVVQGCVVGSWAAPIALNRCVHSDKRGGQIDRASSWKLTGVRRRYTAG
jgi:hypothetical protein